MSSLKPHLKLFWRYQLILYNTFKREVKIKSVNNKIIFIIISFLVSNFSYGITVDSIYQYIKTVDNGVYYSYDGITYSAPTVNTLRSDQNWLLQTPNIWGHSLAEYNYSESFALNGHYDTNFHLPICTTNSDCGPLATCSIAYFTLNHENLCLMPEHTILNRITTNIVSANDTVDIVTLGAQTIGVKPTPTTGKFSLTLQNALQQLASQSMATGKIIKIRILEGSPLPFLQNDLYQYISFLTQNLPANNNLEIQVGSILTCSILTCHNGNPELDFSANHAKVINVDSYNLINGGENLWDDEYLGSNPVNDLDINIYGPIATSATIYANTLWEYLINHPKIGYNYCYTYSHGVILPDCLIPSIGKSSTDSNIKDYSGIQVTAMNVDELEGNVLANSDQSELARVYAFLNAESSIKISQQAIFWKDTNLPNSVFAPINTISGNVIDALAAAIHLHKVNVSIVTSNLQISKIPFWVPQNYNSFVPLQYIQNAIQDTIVTDFSVTPQVANEEVTQLLHLAYIDFNHSNTTAINTHAKFWMVDDHLFYVGSHNIYPTVLQEYGIIIDSSAAAAIFNQDFWQPLWNNSDPMQDR